LVELISDVFKQTSTRLRDALLQEAQQNLNETNYAKFVELMAKAKD